MIHIEQIVQDISPREDVYRPAESSVFRKARDQWGTLSNLSLEFGVTVGVHSCRTRELAYHLGTFSDFEDVQRVLLYDKRSPLQIAWHARSARRRLRLQEKWDSIKLAHMAAVILASMRQNSGLGEVLDRALENGPIIEESHRDRYWACVRRDDRLVGMNMLGRLYTELGTMRRQKPAQVLHVPCHVVPFKILGESFDTIQADGSFC